MRSGNDEKLARFRRLFAPPEPVSMGAPSSLEVFREAETLAESTPFAESTPAADFSADANQDRMERTSDQLDEIIRHYLPNDPNAAEIAKKIRKEGGEALKRLGAGDATLFDDPDAAPVLEVIVANDGSRPTFLIADGQVDKQSSILGTWARMLDEHAAQLEAAIACVGRIDLPLATLGYTGTGFLIHPDLVVTNRHVLQTLGEWDGAQWRLATGVALDFGHEFEGAQSQRRRLVEAVVFAGTRAVNPFQIDHAVLDLVILRLETSSNTPEKFLALSTSKSWITQGEKNVCTIGYPGPPPSAANLSLLDQLFRSHYGYKRLAPGLPMTPSAQLAPWTFAHDATTLGGNSGSVIISLSANGFATGVHYGGKWSTPRENWGHLISDCLEERDQATGKTLREVLDSFQVKVYADAVRSAEQPTPSPLPNGHERGTPRITSSPSHGSGGRAQSAHVVALADMRQLGIRAGASRIESIELEAAGDGETPADSLIDRTGFDPNFLEDWEIKLPQPARDMRTLGRGGSGVELKYQHFSVIMSQSRRMPIITATNVDGAQSRRVPRTDNWRYDGRLNQSDQWGDELYRNNGVDRGHMVRREDPVWGSLATARRANDDTFHYTNSCPQMAGVNQRVWLGLEDYILQHAREDSMRISVFTGPFFSDDDMVYRGAQIPLAFWKIVAFQLDDNRPSATAYEVSQTRELAELEFVFSAYKTFQISIQQVMNRTNIDFSQLVPFVSVRRSTSCLGC